MQNVSELLCSYSIHSVCLAHNCARSLKSVMFSRDLLASRVLSTPDSKIDMHDFETFTDGKYISKMQ